MLPPSEATGPLTLPRTESINILQWYKPTVLSQQVDDEQIIQVVHFAPCLQNYKYILHCLLFMMLNIKLAFFWMGKRLNNLK